MIATSGPCGSTLLRPTNRWMSLPRLQSQWANRFKFDWCGVVVLGFLAWGATDSKHKFKVGIAAENWDTSARLTLSQSMMCDAAGSLWATRVYQVLHIIVCELSRSSWRVLTSAACELWVAGCGSWVVGRNGLSRAVDLRVTQAGTLVLGSSPTRQRRCGRPEAGRMVKRSRHSRATRIVPVAGGPQPGVAELSRPAAIRTEYQCAC